MPAKVINAAGTFNLKQGTGRVYSIYCASVGTAFTIQLNDGPDSAGNVQKKYGALAAGITPASGTYVLAPEMNPIVFRDGIQAVTQGTPGEYTVDYD